MILCVVLPEQVLPSLFRLYPVLQLHRKDPTVLVQTWLQPPLLTAHSLISTDERLQSHIFLCIMLWTYQSKFFHCLKDYSHFCSHNGMIPLCWCKFDHSHHCWENTHWYLQMNNYSHTYYCESCFEPTRASSPIAWKSVTTSAATSKRSRSVCANLITATIVERTLIDFYEKRQWFIIDFSKWDNDTVVLPEHVLPSLFSLYPVLQPHRKDPNVFVQTWLQPPLLTAHSLISAVQY